MQSSIFSGVIWKDLTFYTVDLFYYVYFFWVGTFWGDWILRFTCYNFGLLIETFWFWAFRNGLFDYLLEKQLFFYLSALVELFHFDCYFGIIAEFLLKLV